MGLLQPPFPENGDPQADAIIGVGVSATIMLTILFMTVLILYIYVKMPNDYPIMLIAYLSITILAFSSMTNPYFEIYTPSIEIFLIIWSTSIFGIYSVRYYDDYKNTEKYKNKKSRY